MWTTGDWQLHHNNMPAHASHLMQSVLAKHQITQDTQSPYSPDFVLCDFWLFPKLKSPLKGKRFQTIIEIQENMTGQLMVIGKIVWGPKVPTSKGIVASCPAYNISCIFFSECLHFLYYMAGYILHRPHEFLLFYRTYNIIYILYTLICNLISSFSSMS